MDWWLVFTCTNKLQSNSKLSTDLKILFHTVWNSEQATHFIFYTAIHCKRLCERKVWKYSTNGKPMIWCDSCKIFMQIFSKAREKQNIEGLSLFFWKQISQRKILTCTGLSLEFEKSLKKDAILWWNSI